MKSKTMIVAASIAASLAVNAADAWISADKSGTSDNCSWSNTVTFAEGEDTVTITDNALQPTQEAAADSSLKKVTMTITTTFSVCGDTEETPDDDAQAAVRLTADGFQVWTLVDGAKAWLSVSNNDLVITSSEEEYGAEYEITFVFDYGVQQYSVKVNNNQLTDNGDSDFPMAIREAEKLSEVGFVGSTQFTSLYSWLGEMTQEGFASGDSVSVSGGTVTLNAKQAEWLDSLGEKTTVEGAVATLTADQFNKAWLLNLDITDADWENFSFSVSGFTVYSDHVDVGVTLTRNNAAAIYGTLKFYAEPTLSALNTTTEPATTENLTNANFGEGNEATVSLPLGDGENKPSFFKAGIDEPDEPTE